MPNYGHLPVLYQHRETNQCVTGLMSPYGEQLLDDSHRRPVGVHKLGSLPAGKQFDCARFEKR
ncbi:hypothetical protein DPMN_186500 [Dreissena polymorpha]|uniref:Uncharacterized protein n=1 Tax=Dreissena polymorpha TaxID=45954 RepID=A0A9D4DP69_DREPO|nr:hypothetical protein DPMN_186500 [Dreissena polymorpha]